MITKRNKRWMALFAVLLSVTLIAAACGEDATPTPVPATATSVPTTAVPATATPVPGATATSVPPTVTPAVPQPTATTVPTTGLRPISEWTVDSPATLAEIEAELEKFRGDSLVFASFGGAKQTAQRKAYLEPFSEKFGIEVFEDATSYAKVRAQSEADNVSWHVVDISPGGGGLGENGNLEELDFSIIDVRNNVSVVRAPWHGGGGDLASLVIVYSTDTFPEGSVQPSSPGDFFNVDIFPGRRGIFDTELSWKYILRWGLLGANPELLASDEGKESLVTLEPDEIERAYDFLRGFRPNINVLIQSHADCASLISSGELDMCTMSNDSAYSVIQDGAPLKICWDCGHLSFTDIFVIPEGLREQDPDKSLLAHLFMAWTNFPENNARLSLFSAIVPTNQLATPLLEDPQFDEFKGGFATSPAAFPGLILRDEIADGLITSENVDQFVLFIRGQD